MRIYAEQDTMNFLIAFEIMNVAICQSMLANAFPSEQNKIILKILSLGSTHQQFNVYKDNSEGVILKLKSKVLYHPSSVNDI